MFSREKELHLVPIGRPPKHFLVHLGTNKVFLHHHMRWWLTDSSILVLWNMHHSPNTYIIGSLPLSSPENVAEKTVLTVSKMFIV